MEVLQVYEEVGGRAENDGPGAPPGS